MAFAIYIHVLLYSAVFTKDTNADLNHSWIIKDEGKTRNLSLAGVNILAGCLSRWLRYDKYCHVDQECVLFGDCCVYHIDRLASQHISEFPSLLQNPIQWYQQHFQSIPLNSRIEIFAKHARCVELTRSSVPLMLISTCPLQRSNTMRSLCSYGGPLLPVSLLASDTIQIVYRNIYCSRCHGIADHDTVEWNVSVACSFDMNITSSEEAKTFFKEAFQSSKCRQIFREPRLKAKPRLCATGFNLSSTSGGGKNCNMCRLYFLPVTNGSDTFNNPHCLLCEKRLNSTDHVFIDFINTTCNTNHLEVEVATPGNSHPTSGFVKPQNNPKPETSETLYYHYDLNMLFRLGFANSLYSDIGGDTDISYGVVNDFSEPTKYNTSKVDCRNITTDNSTSNATTDCHQIHTNYTTSNYTKNLVATMVNIVKTADVFSITVIGVSCVFIVILVVMHFILPELRTFHGKTLLSFSVALFLAQMSFLLGSINYRHAIVCKIIAVVGHYSWLCAFLWSSIMAFDITRKFSVCSSLSQRMVTMNSSHRLRAYSIVAWTLPLVYVAANIAAEYCTDRVYLGYGEYGMCWITQTVGLLVGFGIPVALMILFNMICFFVSLHGIEMETRCKNSKNVSKRNRVHCLTYSYLSFLLGLTWLFAFLGAWVHLHAFSYLNVIVNGLQGFFLCCSVLFSAKVRRLLKAKCSHKEIFSSQISKIS